MRVDKIDTYVLAWEKNLIKSSIENTKKAKNGHKRAFKINHHTMLSAKADTPRITPTNTRNPQNVEKGSRKGSKLTQSLKKPKKPDSKIFRLRGSSQLKSILKPAKDSKPIPVVRLDDFAYGLSTSNHQLKYTKKKRKSDKNGRIVMHNGRKKSVSTFKALKKGVSQSFNPVEFLALKQKEAILIDQHRRQRAGGRARRSPSLNSDASEGYDGLKGLKKVKKNFIKSDLNGYVEKTNNALGQLPGTLGSLDASKTLQNHFLMKKKKKMNLAEKDNFTKIASSYGYHKLKPSILGSRVLANGSDFIEFRSKKSQGISSFKGRRGIPKAKEGQKKVDLGSFQAGRPIPNPQKKSNIEAETPSGSLQKTANQGEKTGKRYQKSYIEGRDLKNSKNHKVEKNEKLKKLDNLRDEKERRTPSRSGSRASRRREQRRALNEYEKEVDSLRKNAEKYHPSGGSRTLKGSHRNERHNKSHNGELRGRFMDNLAKNVVKSKGVDLGGLGGYDVSGDIPGVREARKKSTKSRSSRAGSLNGVKKGVKDFHSKTFDRSGREALEQLAAIRKEARGRKASKKSSSGSKKGSKINRKNSQNQSKFEGIEHDFKQKATHKEHKDPQNDLEIVPKEPKTSKNKPKSQSKKRVSQPKELAESALQAGKRRLLRAKTVKKSGIYASNAEEIKKRLAGNSTSMKGFGGPGGGRLAFAFRIRKHKELAFILQKDFAYNTKLEFLRDFGFKINFSNNLFVEPPIGNKRAVYKYFLCRVC